MPKVKKLATKKAAFAKKRAKRARVGDETVVSNPAALSSLTSLDISDNELGVQGALALARSPHLKALRELDLGGNDIGDEGARAIA